MSRFPSRPVTYIPRRPAKPWNIDLETEALKKQNERSVMPLSPDEVEKIFRAAMGHPRDYCLLVLVYFYALLPGEPGLLVMSDVDLSARSLHVRRLYGADRIRSVIPSRVLRALRDYLAVRPQRRWLGDGLPPEEDFLFPVHMRVPTPDGARVVGISSDVVYDRTRKYARVAEIELPERAGGLGLRQASIVHRVLDGWTTPQLQKLLGLRDVERLQMYEQAAEALRGWDGAPDPNIVRV